MTYLALKERLRVVAPLARVVAMLGRAAAGLAGA